MTAVLGVSLLSAPAIFAATKKGGKVQTKDSAGETSKQKADKQKADKQKTSKEQTAKQK